MANAARTPINEATFLAKAFASALHPTRIIPFYYRSTGLVEDDDVTITTLVTANRFKVFKELVERYQGPISVTVHIPFPADASLASLPLTHPSVTALNRLHTLYTSSPFFSKYVDVHLALSPFAASARPGKHTDYAHAEDHTMEQEGEGEGGRQFNVWRNTARLFARTEFVMMLDVDFAVCTDWRQAVRDALEVVRELKEGRAALVVPAFEYANLEDGMDQRKFPRDKESLVQLTRESPPSLTSFHAAWAPGHNSTDYPQYYSIPPSSGEVYRVTQYQSAYEPYVIMSKRVTWCDERFTGYGANKAACLFEMYLSGVSFYVLADHFLIHQSHTYEEEARREERKYNRKLYSDFKEEACLR
ncbi:glycosyltransferase family 49 protein [Postia placenta MAD-698-R-SB12]|uniref:Glycosyltransferase family 49 protein n=1 Tax=Postia placenta MAD-698-R-SB12 TaxID=670580 RepID=A0A1X6N004_9APHY|nr:glycosyltransferase family 49 protein [Postia placenta MAD-698-R-SB12]OSX61822.1 glycosyltransferase family 49 protein [Postia placenta MAD-698-R-SB12]